MSSAARRVQLASRRREINKSGHIFDGVPTGQCLICGEVAREGDIIVRTRGTFLDGNLCEAHTALLLKTLKRVIPKRRFQLVLSAEAEK